jgi:peptidoglycan biosynthesis protein MviN/MurJ (putative lipid II flippase)
VNIGADIVFTVALGWGIAGMTLGYAASYAAGSALLFGILAHRIGGADGRRIGWVVARTLPIALIAGGAAWVVSDLVGSVGSHPVAILQVLAGVAGGVLVFLVLALIVHVREVDDVVRALRARFRR